MYDIKKEAGGGGTQKVNKKIAPFQFDALRPFVSTTLHIIDQHKELKKGEEAVLSKIVVEEVSNKLDSLFNAIEVDGKNRFNISPHKNDRGIIPTESDEYGLSLTGIWFKRITAPTWMHAVKGPKEVRDITNHILILAVRYPYLAIIGTYSKIQELLSDGLEQGDCGKVQLSFIAKRIKPEELERAFIRGKNRVSWLSALHASTETKPDAKTLVGPDLRRALDPFSDQTFTFTSTVNILPLLEISRQAKYHFNNSDRENEYTHYAFRVGVSPEQQKVWTLAPTEFDHFKEELHVLFDTLDLPADRKVIKDWCYYQDGFKFLGKPIPGTYLNQVTSAFDVGLDLPPPVETGKDIRISSEIERCRELWRAYGQMEVIPPENSHASNFRARVSFGGNTILELDIFPQTTPDGKIDLQPKNRQFNLTPFHEGVTCFETLLEEDRGVTMTVHYDSGHVIRGPRLFRMGWEDVLFDSWEWKFLPTVSGRTYSQAREKPVNPTEKAHDVPKRTKKQGWETILGTDMSDTHGEPAHERSLFEYLIDNAKKLFSPGEGKDWYLCCDDGPGEVADFVYFEPEAGRLYLIHIKSANTKNPDRNISVKAYEEVIGQAIKNLRYLDLKNLEELLGDDKAKKRPMAEVCFHNGTKMGNRDELLDSLNNYKHRLRDKKVIVFQPHVQKTIWENALNSWMQGEKPTPHNHVNRFLQLRTILADAEITCKKIGAQFEVWGEDDNEAESLK